ncbi:MAG: DNA mismatch repair protein MutS [Bacteroidota bacterium]
MKDKQTPLMRQYYQVKNKYPDTILLFRMGDFFETFEEDAVTTSKVCGITLTKRNNGGGGETPLAGFPHHQLDAYLPKLVRAGYRVAVCEQLEDPKQARGIVRRGVVEVVTPGVALYDKLLDTKKNNYVAALFLNYEKKQQTFGLACADISTGDFFTCEFSAERLSQILDNLIPAEVLISKAQKNEITELLTRLSLKPVITKLEPWIFDKEFGREALLGHFKTQNLKGFGIDDLNSGIASAGAILYYMKETQNGQLQHITRIALFNPDEFMTLDYATRRNLEITYSYSDASIDGTLISILDKTCSPMGGRLFKQWITRPLLKLEQINKRLDCVRSLFDSDSARKELTAILSSIGDLERLISKICTGRANPRDLIALKVSLKLIPEIKAVLKSLKSDNLSELEQSLILLENVVELIETALVETPTVQLGTGAVFKNGFNSELDSYVDAKFSGKKWLSEYQERERVAHGINTLKVGFTSVFGYYIEISKAQNKKAPENYQRKQTLTNAERYTTPELKEFEEKIFNAEDKILSIEQELFADLRTHISDFTKEIQHNAKIISVIDCLCSFAEVSKINNYTEPKIDNSDIIEIVGGRHPVVERMLQIGENYTPNSTVLNPENNLIHIITGPNMAGKSCYLRQVGLIVLLGQIGCFVPAESATFGLVDRIFTRVGAQDNITSGESTFLVEMQEAANIINNATYKSLILLDEVGRGTATFDGISLAWAITEYIHNILKSKTLFATHYHELNELAERYPNIANYKVEVIEAGENIIFSHKVKPGATDHSFGIHVAQMAGMPNELISRAYDIMKNFESADTNEINKSKKPDVKSLDTISSRRTHEQLSIFEIKDDVIREQLLKLDINKLTPIDALKILSDMQKNAKKH